MKTKSIEVCDAVVISVSCKENDSVDINCGGPAMLGYDFGVSPDEDIEDWKKKIKGFIHKYHRPFIGISHHTQKDFPVEHLWSLERIEECIKENGIW